MAKNKLDLSINRNAEISRNKTALICMTVTTVILALAYFLEVLKEAWEITLFWRQPVWFRPLCPGFYTL